MFAAYLAKNYLAKKGFKPGTVPEAAALAEASDFILTRADGMSLHVLCIVDGEAHPGKRFTLSRDAVEEIGIACLKYTGKVSGNKMPVQIQIVEVGGTADAPSRERLKPFKRKSWRSKVMPSAWIVDTAAQAVWSNAPFNGLLAGRRFLERLLREPPVPDAELQPEAPAAVAPERRPLLTWAMLAVLAGVYGAELYFAAAPASGLLSPSIQTLAALGGLNRNLVLESGEWYRLFSAALLHGGVIHLALNGLCLFLAGTVLERLVGRLWLLALFVLGALGGGLLSLALNPPNIVSVGASGAIMGLLAAAFACSFRFPSGAQRMQIQMTALQVLIPSLLPLAFVRGGDSHVDYAGHLGGALVGALAGLMMLKTWPAQQPYPRFKAAAAAIALCGIVAFALSFLPAARQLHLQRLDALLIPRADLPKSWEDMRARGAALAARYPRDPRARLYEANRLIAARDFAGAERELRAGLAEKEILQAKFKPGLAVEMQALLALVVLDRGDPIAARREASLVCASPDVGRLRDPLLKSGLCN